ncbi:MAG: hypothetical protein IJS46_02985, partial [Kiritimatiellae bacterium]|nr:hypothetical protein [Kiritimatiellia bacterium]
MKLAFFAFGRDPDRIDDYEEPRANLVFEPAIRRGDAFSALLISAALLVLFLLRSPFCALPGASAAT